jgi:ABC-type glycerol-3-phosphate transport system permease component
MTDNLSVRKRSKGILAKKLMFTVLLIIVACLVILPFFWMISTSLKSNVEVFRMPPKWIPNSPDWGNYLHVLFGVPFLTYLKNTVIITFLNIIGTVLSCSLVAYGLARIEFKGRKLMFYLIISTMMIPPQVYIIPQFILFKEIGWINTFKPLIVPEWFAASAFNIFLLRQFFMSIPRDLDEAAMIDGCSRFRIYWNIILPNSKPALATITIFAFMYNWNEFLKPLIFINSDALKPLATGITIFKHQHSWEWNYVMGASVLMILPCLLLFFFAQRYFIQGISVTGTKG